MNQRTARTRSAEPQHPSTSLVGLRDGAVVSTCRNTAAVDLRTMALGLAYAGTVPAANRAIQRHGIVEV